MRKVVIIVVVLALAGVGYWYLPRLLGSSGKQDKFMTAKITKGPISLEVTSTGAINSVVTVQVGTQVSGTILELLADYNTKVKQGQVVAKLDPALFKAAVDREKANIASSQAAILKCKAAVADAKRTLDTADALYKAQVAQARANLAVAKANVEKSKATDIQTKLNLERANKLVQEKTIAQSEKDDAQANYDAAEALLHASEAQVELNQANLDLTEVQSKNARDNAQTNYDSAVAQLNAAEAQLEQAKAAYDLAQVNYDHSIITSPIDGIVVSRAVDVGQTVAASLASPTLFTIANDLTKMQVEATVDEADIGKIKVGQRATFTVDAFPDDEFEGTVSQVRLQPTTVQNVVTYTVIVSVTNTQSKLMPGMTANTTFHIEQRDDALRVPNSALRFQPPESLIEPAALKEMQERMKMFGAAGREGAARGGPGTEVEKGAGGREIAKAGGRENAKADGAPGKEGGKGGPPRTHRRGSQVWVKAGAGLLKPIRFTPGLADAKYTEVVKGDLTEDQEVVIGTTEAQQAAPSAGPLSGVRRF